ncbi:MAG: hypothetical protein ABIN01_11025 [Ferruginibacter sp.]
MQKTKIKNHGKLSVFYFSIVADLFLFAKVLPKNRNKAFSRNFNINILNASPV